MPQDICLESIDERNLTLEYLKLILNHTHLYLDYQKKNDNTK